MTSDGAIQKEEKDLFDRGEEAIEIYGLVGVKIKKRTQKPMMSRKSAYSIELDP